MKTDRVERYFLDSEDEEIILKDIDDNWNIDMDLAIDVAAERHNCTHRQILQMPPSDKFVEYLIYCNVIPDINRCDFLDNNFNREWLDNYRGRRYEKN